MLTVPDAATRTGRHPETIRRWIRSGRLRARKIGTQHVIQEEDLDALTYEDVVPLPPDWYRMWDGSPMPNWVRVGRDSRRGH